MNGYFSRSFLLFISLFLAHEAQAATLYMEPVETEIFSGDTISVKVRLDTDEGECVNVVDAVVTYDGNVVPVDIGRGDSIVPIWVEDPQIDKENRRITFAGGIPNGYCGRIAGDPRLTNILLEIIFQAPAFFVGIGARDDIADINFSRETSILLNDGFGTPASLQTFGSHVLVNKQPRDVPINDWTSRVDADNLPPQDFAITLAADSSIYNSRYFITFNTTDKQSGLDHYEIMEEPIDDFDLFKWGAANAPWKTGRSPYLLLDQTLNSTIRVKAVDKAGNEYVAVYVPAPEMRGVTDRDLARLGLLLSGVLVILITLSSIVYYRIIRSKKLLPEETSGL
jgi:hypothetical protein